MDFFCGEYRRGGRGSRHRKIYWHRHRHRDLKIGSFQICRLRRDGKGGGVSAESLTLPATASVTVNATVTLTPVITPADADKSLTWTSNENNIASVAEGVVTGKSPGTATITAVSKSNPTKSAACAVTVSAVPVPLTALGVSPASASLLVNGELRLNAVFTPENTTDRAVTWTSSDETVATVDANGLVKAKTATGQATV